MSNIKKTCLDNFFTRIFYHQYFEKCLLFYCFETVWSDFPEKKKNSVEYVIWSCLSRTLERIEISSARDNKMNFLKEVPSPLR